MVLEPDIRGIANKGSVFLDEVYGLPGPLGYKFGWSGQGVNWSRPGTLTFFVVVFQAGAYTAPYGQAQLGAALVPMTYHGTYNSMGDGLGLNTHGDRSVWTVHIFSVPYDGQNAFTLQVDAYFSDLGGVPGLSARGFASGVYVNGYMISAVDLNDPGNNLYRGKFYEIVPEWGTSQQIGTGKPINLGIPGHPLGPTPSGFAQFYLSEPGEAYIDITQPVMAADPYVALFEASGSLAPGASIQFDYAIPTTHWNVLFPSEAYATTKAFFYFYASCEDLAGSGIEFGLDVQDATTLAWQQLTTLDLVRDSRALYEIRLNNANPDPLFAVDIRQTGQMRLVNHSVDTTVVYTNVTVGFPDIGNEVLAETGPTTGPISVVGSATAQDQTRLLGDNLLLGIRHALVPKTRRMRLHIYTDDIGASGDPFAGASVFVPAGLGGLSDEYSVTIPTRIYETYFVTPGRVRSRGLFNDINGDANSFVQLTFQLQTNSGAWIDFARTDILKHIQSEGYSTLGTGNEFPQTINMRVKNTNGLGPYTINGTFFEWIAVADVLIGIDIFEQPASELGDGTTRSINIVNLAYGDEYTLDLGALLWDDTYFPEPALFSGIVLWASPLNDEPYMALGGDGVNVSFDWQLYSDVTEVVSVAGRPSYQLFNGSDNTLITDEFDPEFLLNDQLVDPSWTPIDSPIQSGIENFQPIRPFTAVTQDPNVDYLLAYRSWWIRAFPSGLGRFLIYPVMNWMAFGFSITYELVAARPLSQARAQIIG